MSDRTELLLDDPALDATRAFIAAFDADHEWKKDGRCRPSAASSDPDDLAEIGERSRWWTVYRQDPPSSNGFSATHMAEAALLLCQMCPVQWDCVRYAVEARESYTWAATETDREILARRSDWRGLVAEAEASGTSVQKLIESLEG